jgi:hypothetical protein
LSWLHRFTGPVQGSYAAPRNSLRDADAKLQAQGTGQMSFTGKLFYAAAGIFLLAVMLLLLPLGLVFLLHSWVRTSIRAMIAAVRKLSGAVQHTPH